MRSPRVDDAQHLPRIGTLTERTQRPRSVASIAWRRYRRDRPAVAGLIVLLLLVLLALSAGLISEHVTGFSPTQQDIRNRFQPIGSNGYLLGSDQLGRDTFTRLLFGARVSLGIAGLSIVVALLVGAAYGVVSGYFGGWVDGVLMRIVDVLLAVPSLFLLLLIASMWRMGPLALAFVIAATAWVTLSRLVRGEVLALRQREYVEAARIAGDRPVRVMVRHILPNVLPVIIVWASLTVPGLILAEAGLSYLGLGIQPPTPSWGNMLSDSQRVWSHSAALVLLPGIAIYLAVFAINLVGNGLRDALDPRLTE
ncbi:MAG: peptide ABC transporter permease [Chloroflexi bacterium]|nr:MAG: peptide ABC transporter permease [Chloroflexota bacterium]